MRVAVNAALDALNSRGSDPSNGAFWWDDVDLTLKKGVNPRIKQDFRYASHEHDIFDLMSISKAVVIYWRVIDKNKKRIVDGAERGRYDAVYISTAACGKTIFWRYSPEYVKASGAKEYK